MVEGRKIEHLKANPKALDIRLSNKQIKYLRDCAVTNFQLTDFGGQNHRIILCLYNSGHVMRFAISRDRTSSFLQGNRSFGRARSTSCRPLEQSTKFPVDPLRRRAVSSAYIC
ncbi:uncharacterized protein BT62DRAFT_49958 [Guyanagaster necrorhizus]|uniref:Uncharacterized protein n=1 Tax=Guyanagaster necrorhizus TaxID=856835 RepID=A0A9P7W5W7_9AGAR|nr:uncharacterized protein BT62DRAFT_49958 [Guyanagaster necrorhizus MCA 3950]KAG7453174.1 hypothetical protein BT62DRAFT_49958 [Guyanagaster necrorhizus MCA 3950]